MHKSLLRYIPSSKDLGACRFLNGGDWLVLL